MWRRMRSPPGGPTEAGQRTCALKSLRADNVLDAILVSIDGIDDRSTSIRIDTWPFPGR